MRQRIELKPATIWLVGALSLALFIGFSLFVYLYAAPEIIVDTLGAKNVYIIMFLTAFFSALVVLYPMPYYPLLIVLATSGVHPLLLGLTAALGVTIGDLVSYLVGQQGARIVPKRAQRIMDTTSKIIRQHPRLFPIFCFFYGAMSPFSNDLITIPAGLLRHPYAQTIIPLALGNTVFNIVIAYAAARAYSAVAFFG